MLTKRIPTLVAVCALTGVAGAGNAPPGPDFQSADGRAEIAPMEVIPFSFDSAALDTVSKIQLREVARWMNMHPGYRVVVAGHTDAAGGEIYNLILAARRATAVRDELAQYGIARDRVVLAVYGKARRLSRDPYAASNRVAVLYAKGGPSSTAVASRGPDLIDVMAEALGQSSELKL